MSCRISSACQHDQLTDLFFVPSSSVPDSTLHHAQSHKRIVSAPPGTLESDAMPETRSSVAAAHDGHHHHYSHRLAAEPVGPMSPAASSTHADDLAVTPATLPGAASPAVPTPPPELHCMYTENCDTGAQPRKVITHFFGRNKSCTMMIPPEVWVHYCRKHYQRVRYRNFDSFPLVQIDLVRTQVERIDAWSLENQRAKSSGGPGSAASGPPGRYVKAWTLALRKREQRRLGGAASGDDDANSTDEATSAPPWVRKSVGNGYTTAQILAIVERLKDELVAETLDAIPDIEFLPEICDESLDGPGGPGSGSGSGSGRRSGGTTRRYNKRKSMHAAGPSGARPMHDDKRPRIMTVDEAAPRSMPPPPSHLDQHHRHYVLDTRDDWRAPPGGHWAERHPHHHAPHGHHGQGHYVFQGGQPHSHVAAPPPRPPQRLPLPGAHSHAPPPPRYLPPIVDSPGPETASAYWNGSGHQAPWAGRPYYAEPPRVLPPPR